MPRFFVFLTNFNYYLDTSYDSLEAAATAGKVRGFEFSIVRSDKGQHPFKADAGTLQRVATWTTFSGLRTY